MIVAPASKVLSLLRDKYSSNAQSIRGIWRGWDVSHDGHVERDEVSDMLHKMGVRIQSGEEEKFFRLFDVDGDGEVNYNEFMRAIIDTSDETYRRNRNGSLWSNNNNDDEQQQQQPTRQPSGVRDVVRAAQIHSKVTQRLQRHKHKMADLFREMDNNGDGTVSYGEFRSALKKLHINGLTTGDISLLWSDVDVNGDGRVDVKEFATKLMDASAPGSLPLFTKRIGKRNNNNNSKSNVLPDRTERFMSPTTSFVDFNNLSDLQHTQGLPTRGGKRPNRSTSELITGPSDDLLSASALRNADDRFQLESRRYGSSCCSDTQEIDRRKHNAKLYANRLQRIRNNQQRVEEANAANRESWTIDHQRRVETLVRHRLQYYRMLQGRFEKDRQRQLRAGI